MVTTKENQHTTVKSNELRIGNLLTVKYTKQIKEDFVTEIKGYDIVRIEENDFNTLNYEPIPLTEEWLLKFGFNCDLAKTYTKQIEKNTFELRFDKLDKIIVLDVNINYEDTYLEFKHIKYIHQIQNLYFALTNEELTFKQ